MSGMDSSTRWLIGFVVALGVLAFVALALARAGGVELTTYPANSPEGVVQTYLQALDDGDADDVLMLFSGDLVRPCISDRIRLDFPRDKRNIERRRFSLVEVRELSSDRVAVDIRIALMQDPELFSPPPGESSSETVIILDRRADESWAIAELPWPLEYNVEQLCGEERPPESPITIVSPSGEPPPRTNFP